MQETIKNCVYELRRSVGMTQDELAQKVGVTRQTIFAIERGNYVPSVLLALKISKVFDTLVEKVFSISYEK